MQYYKKVDNRQRVKSINLALIRQLKGSQNTYTVMTYKNTNSYKTNYDLLLLQVVLLCLGLLHNEHLFLLFDLKVSLMPLKHFFSSFRAW